MRAAVIRVLCSSYASRARLLTAPVTISRDSRRWNKKRYTRPSQTYSLATVHVALALFPFHLTTRRDTLFYFPQPTLFRNDSFFPLILLNIIHRVTRFTSISTKYSTLFFTNPSRLLARVFFLRQALLTPK